MKIIATQVAPGIRTGKEASLSSIPEFDETQLAAARVTAWHQAADPVLTLEAARTWLTHRLADLRQG